ncbi:unnamed protein product [Moneuplotes crassus]|uniref:Uncharacterized protein n=1 Tax=Euplotes crassus TaxID=5936 RepID=A0AAD1XUD9_EUPCR|nr:unnamed protein product [Moneuplotes crassus]
MESKGDMEVKKNNVVYEIEKDGDRLVPENWREIADMRLKMLDQEYEKVICANELEKPTQEDEPEEEPKDETEIQDVQKDQEEKEEKVEQPEKENPSEDQTPSENQKENEEDSDEFGEFQEGNYCMLGSDGALSNSSDTEEEDTKQENDEKVDNPIDEKVPQVESNPSDEVELTEEKVNKIKSAMSKLNLTPPPWAQAIPEEQWLPKFFGSKNPDLKFKIDV